MAENTYIEWKNDVQTGTINEPPGCYQHRPAVLTTTAVKERVMAEEQPMPNYRHSQVRDKNPNWRGGRVIASNGYVLIRVGTDHHLADVRGYAYEHRLAAEEKIGRRMIPGELVHHVNGNKQDNRPENLEVVIGNAEHFVHHRKMDLGRRMPGEDNPIVECECGCGHRFSKYDSSGRPRRYVSGHNPQGRGLGASILDYLENVPESGRCEFIAQFMVLETRQVAGALAKLKAKGRVEIVGGEWRLAR